MNTPTSVIFFLKKTPGLGFEPRAAGSRNKYAKHFVMLPPVMEIVFAGATESRDRA